MSNAQAHAGGGAAPEPLRVLLAEDNPVNALYLVRLLEMCGHTVLTAVNGLEVLRTLRREPVDLIFMDIRMPGMDGVEATLRIRAHDGSSYDPKIPIVALTAYATSPERELFLSQGMDEYLCKPVLMDRLRPLLERYARLLARTADGSRS